MIDRFIRHIFRFTPPRLTALASLLAFLLVSFSLPAAAEEFLPPEEAFRASVRALDSQTVEVNFDIAPGYYLYRDKFRFSAEPALLLPAGAPALPRGKQKHDENFGDVEVYYEQLSLRLPINRNRSGTLPLTLLMTSQGCAEGGICYPPQAHRLSVSLPDSDMAATTASNPPTAIAQIAQATKLPPAMDVAADLTDTVPNAADRAAADRQEEQEELTGRIADEWADARRVLGEDLVDTIGDPRYVFDLIELTDLLPASYLTGADSARPAAAPGAGRERTTSATAQEDQ